MNGFYKHPMHKDNACQEKPNASLISLGYCLQGQESYIFSRQMRNMERQGVKLHSSNMTTTRTTT
ncbi:hypothetical protein SORBI_3003G394701 [Sorghum bicolor]|uniref:Uncharacterized protein n=1 Tax=Sorghum bicolor TaxID=4558 RepID=A0A1W0W143_SORBI|nr:hypothetical protein SORBI_3003G394701 [Sorghum bicolor]OQU88073.1 hypothetical protein SORBI_3003G394701 [Sorghum bicolor]